jgi:predicted AlkP superfamily pyrophosphatase or phosphodiesterase
MKLLLLFVLNIVLLGNLFAQKKVLIIGIDGCRPDALMASNSPNLKTLMAAGIFTLNAQADELTVSGPSWSSMLTGVPSSQHQVLDNSFDNNNLAEHPHFFSFLPKEMRLVSVAHWFPINKFIAKGYADRTGFRFDPGVANRCTGFLERRNAPDVIFLHFDAVDHAGHSTGFSPNNPDYIAAIEKIDGYVGQILQALNDRKSRMPNEDWLLISSTDHGGRDTGHGGGKEDPERRNVFIIAQNDHWAPKQIFGGNVMDVTATILDFLGIQLEQNRIEGVSLLKQ